MKKRFVSIFLIIVLIFGLMITVSADQCTHPVYICTEMTEVLHTPYDDDCHCDILYERMDCLYCDYYYYYPTTYSNFGNHTWGGLIYQGYVYNAENGEWHYLFFHECQICFYAQEVYIDD
jgi:hypothetical protein